MFEITEQNNVGFDEPTTYKQHIYEAASQDEFSAVENMDLRN